jgi:hypothetical protein
VTVHLRVSAWTNAQDVEMSGADGVASGEILSLFWYHLHRLTAHCAVSGCQVGDTYSSDMLPHHKPPYFAHEKSVLVQHQIKDKNGMLITPPELYGKLSLLGPGFTLDLHQQEQEPAILGLQGLFSLLCINSLILFTYTSTGLSCQCR